MQQTQTQSISQTKFLTMSANLLFRALLEPARTEAKKLFRELVDGRPVHITDVRMEDKSTLRFMLSLDHTELGGRLNYGAFRASVATLVNNIGEHIKAGNADLQLFTRQDNPDVNLFGLTAVTYEGEEPRVMVLGAEALRGEGAMMLRLMYIDPAQFQGESQQA